jgi:dTDP-4-dehydrorhamnose reductase
MSRANTPAAKGMWAGPAVLLGGDGMLGRAFQEQLASRGLEVLAPSRDDVDLTNHDTIRKIKLPSGGLLINCAAWTDVDAAEENEAETMSVNGQAIGALLSHCAEAGARLVTFSSDYVFDGNASAAYRPNSVRAPISAYGRSKALGEEMLEQEKGGDWVNIRTSWLYAPWGKNFVRTMAKLLKEKKELKVVNDQRGRPTSAEHLAKSTLALLERDVRGHWHITDGGACTWFEFTLEIKRLLKGKAEIKPCGTAEFPRPAKRPAYSVLDISATEKLLGPMPPWRDNLAEVVGRLEPLG